ncbi:hypothetical protein [Mycobacterium paragordonae]|uniref:hypothetical protein n=1 Tax=Mycobacterium paragordonae TaxID=1389713 RepID=UPI00398698FD
MTDPTERARILAALAEQQARQRQHHVTELADLYTRITELRTELKTAEQTYRAAYRRAAATGLLTGPQLRTLGLPPIDARRRPKPPTTATAQATLRTATPEPSQ